MVQWKLSGASVNFHCPIIDVYPDFTDESFHSFQPWYTHCGGVLQCQSLAITLFLLLANDFVVL